MSVTDPILVCGFGRCGSSLMMQMLARGGVPCVGHYPAFEDPRARNRRELSRPDFAAQYAGRAIKVLDPHRVGLPGAGRIIWLDRSTSEQARSFAKFSEMMGIGTYGRAQRRELERHLVADRKKVHDMMRGRQVLLLSFEQLLARPHACAAKVWAFIDRAFDIEAAAREVIPRGPECREALEIELMLMERAMGVEGVS